MNTDHTPTTPAGGPSWPPDDWGTPTRVMVRKAPCALTLKLPTEDPTNLLGARGRALFGDWQVLVKYERLMHAARGREYPAGTTATYLMGTCDEWAEAVRAADRLRTLVVDDDMARLMEAQAVGAMGMTRPEMVAYFIPSVIQQAVSRRAEEVGAAFRALAAAATPRTWTAQERLGVLDAGARA